MNTCILPSQYDVVALDEVKAHLRLDHSYEDDYIKVLMRAMANMAEDYTGKSLLTQTWKLVHHRPASCQTVSQYIELPKSPLIEIVSVEHMVANQKLKPIKRYTLEKEGEINRLVCSADYNTVHITYKAGYGELPHHVPAAIRQAILLGIGEMFEKRQNAFVNNHTLVHALLRTYCTRRIG